MGFFSNIINSVKQATRSRFELNKTTNTLQLLLNSKDENYFTLEFDTMDTQRLNDPSTLNAYKIVGTNNTLGNLYIEAIRLQHNCKWNVAPGSGFNRFLQEQFKKEELRYIESSQTDFAKFSKYQINYEDEIGVIWLSLNQYEVFIIDPKGKLFNDLVKIYALKNPNLTIEDTTKELPLDISSSLTATNLRENYFS
jgi:hypothetical protein